MPGNPPKSVLVVQTAFIGDVILVIPLLQVINRLWPEARLDMLVRPPSDNLLGTLTFLNRIIVYDKYGRERGISAFRKLAKTMQSNAYDLIICPHRSFRSGFLCYLSGAKKRIGFARGGGMLFHSTRVRYPRQTHEILRNIKLLGTYAPDVTAEKPEVPSTAEDIAFVDTKLGIVQDRQLIALTPGSVWYTKRWPTDYSVEFGQKCIDAGYNLVLLGGAEDLHLCTAIKAALGDGCLNLAGETTLRQSIEVMRRCEILITNDSAPTHLGTAAGTRVLTIFGSTVPDFGFAPYGSKGKSLGVPLDCRPCTDHGRQRCPKKHFRCMKEITPDDVFMEVERMIADIQL